MPWVMCVFSVPFDSVFFRNRFLIFASDYVLHIKLLIVLGEELIKKLI